MQVASPGRPHLSYCTNIHPGESLAEVRSVVAGHVPRVKALLGVSGPFGVGLRLSAGAAEELDQPAALESFRTLLAEHGLYVFTINGFPYGAFHGERVKEAVYRPDWREPSRGAYSDRLARLLAQLLPEGVSGSISTVPGSFRARAQDPSAAAEMAAAILGHVATLARVHDETGHSIELALEPEPYCFLETTDDAVRFFEAHLFSRASLRRFSELTGRGAPEAEALIRRHVGLCVDACHLAVEFEDAADAVRKIRGAGIRIGKVQVTTALAVDLEGNAERDLPTLRALERFDDGVYLHQVVERRDGRLIRRVDLPEAIAEARALPGRGPAEWRVHFHVPVFAARLHPFRSTQPFLRDLLGIARQELLSPHLEVETYTWGVLPEEHRGADVDQAIARELEYTLGELGLSPGPGGQAR